VSSPGGAWSAEPEKSARIDVIAPSGSILSPAALENGLARLQAIGCTVRNQVSGTPWLRFAGTDDERLAAIHQVARADDNDLVMIARGGYGLSRLLDRIDWPLVAASVRRGVRWVGFSDFTVFQVALLAATGAPSWAGPAVCADFGEAEPEPYMLEQFQCLLAGRAPVVEWLADPAGGAPPRPVAPIEGVLWGGNLAMIASLAGSPWMPRIGDGLLFVEDIAEHPYRVERMLLQLLHAGVLGRQRAILFGAFTNWKPAPHDNGYDLSTVARYLEDRLGIPVIEGLPFGHIRRRAVLGIGLRYRLEAATAGADRQSTRLRLTAA